MYDIKDIMKVLPHRPPFLLIDQILECGTYEVGQKVVAKKNITMSEDVFRGHFPGEPVFPGVLILESLAQTGAFMLLSQEEFKGKIAYFGGADKVKFRQMVKPGDTLILEVELTKNKGRIGTCKGKAYVNEKVCASAELTFIVN